MIFTVDPVERQPFKNTNGEYYCNICKQYSNNFYASAIETEYRRCRACHRKSIETYKKTKVLDRIDLLTRNLKQNLYFQKANSIARAVKRKHVVQLLGQYGVNNTQEDLAKIKTIRPNYDPVVRRWKFMVIFKNSPQHRN